MNKPNVLLLGKKPQPQKNQGIVILSHRELTGHGVGRKFHTRPEIPHYGTRGKGLKLRTGMVFTVEPMLNLGTCKVNFLADGWTVITKDKKSSAQFEPGCSVVHSPSKR